MKDFKYSVLHIVSIALLMLIIMMCPQYIFAQKRHLTKDDYHLWGTMYIDKLADNGKWVSFQMNYDDSPDTLFIKSTDGKKQYKFAGVNTGEFGGGHWFAFKNPDQSLSVLSMATGNIMLVAEVESYAFSADGGYLITLETHQDKKQLQVRDKSGKVMIRIPDIKNYKVSPDGLELVYTTTRPDHSTISWISLKYPAVPLQIKEAVRGSFDEIEWQENSASFAFIHQFPQSSSQVANDVYVYNLKSKSMNEIRDDMIRVALSGKRIAEQGRSRLSISPDGSKVFFGVDPVQKPDRFSPDSIQVWNGNDKWTYTERKNYSHWEDIPVMVCWSRETRNVVLINEGRPQIFFNASMQYAISYNEMEVGPQYNPSADVNYYITDLDTGATSLWLPEAGPGNYDFSISPSGKYLGYFREGNYWIYDFAMQKHINVTSGIIAEWRDSSSAIGELFGIAGWGKDDKVLLLHDKFDIYKIDLITGKSILMTDGREKNCKYTKIITEINSHRAKFNFYVRPAINLAEPLAVVCECETKSSFALIPADGKWRNIASGEQQTSDIRKAKDADAFIYVTQRYDRPPSLHFTKGRISALLFSSNPIHDQFLWGRSQVIEYKNTAGVQLKGLLTYPAGYDSSKRYPMVVFVYEKQLRFFYRYINPSEYNMSGFNVSNLASQGYFVFRPDIEYKMGDPGISAADCTIAAVRAVIDKNVVDNSKIGLIGHSFGGYETNFIVTQTNLFAAAVSGAGVADMQSHYLSIGWNNGQPEIFRFENQQWRMRKSLFEDREAYERNSPVLHAENIRTPLLIWSGELDRQVHYYQSIAFYLALRRLEKEQVMVLYPNEGHSLLSMPFQADLTKKVEDWFSHYLKGDEKEWIILGTK